MEKNSGKMTTKAKNLGDELSTGMFGNLTKREYFAAIVMHGILANPEVTDMDKAAKLAIMACDALLEELSK